MVGGVEEGGGEKLRNSNDVERVFVSVGFDYFNLKELTNLN